MASSTPPQPRGIAARKQSWTGYAGALFFCLVATACAVALRGEFAEANLVLIYLLHIVLTTVCFGRGPGVLACLLSVLGFNFFLVEPIHTFLVSDPQYVLTFVMMLAVSLVINYLTANLQQQAMLAHANARRANVLFALANDLSSAVTLAQVADVAATHVADAFNATSKILVANQDGKLDLSVLAGLAGIDNSATSGVAQAILARAQKNDEPCSISQVGTMQFITLRAPAGVRGVLMLMMKSLRLLEQPQLLQAFAAQIALAIERVYFASQSAKATIAMEAEQLRNSLLSAMSHDVRTPLAGIIGLSSTLASTEALPHSTVTELARSIQSEAARMNTLITNLLDLARLQTGHPHLRLEWQLLEEVVGSALAASHAALREMKVTLRLPATLPLVAYDAVLIERVLCNLFENAARHAQCGGWIGVSAVTTDTELLVSISDRGPGVAAANSDQLFSKFIQGGSASKQEGIGLGLAICRTIVNAHGGRIWVEAAADGGACFTFSLPLGVPPSLSLRDDVAHAAQ